jgi:transposase
MSPAFPAATSEEFPNAAQTVDRFHVVQLFTHAMDETLRVEARKERMPKGTRRTTLKGFETERSAEQEAALRELTERGLSTATAFRVKEMLRWVRVVDGRRAAQWWASRFINAAREVTGQNKLLAPVGKALLTFENYLPVLRRWESLLSNARLEGTNGLFQAAWARARGYRNDANFITIIHLIGASITALLQGAIPQ